MAREGTGGRASTASPSNGHGFVDEEILRSVLDRAMVAMGEAEFSFLVMGGIASSLYGRKRGTGDIDLFVRLSDSERVLEVLGEAGFDTEVVYPHWLSKAHAPELTVDVISRSSPDILLDDEMLERARSIDFKGLQVPLVPPEDLFVMKALATSEDRPRYWYDAIAIVGHTDMDWPYLLRRARANGARRVLSALLYAQSNDLIVPSEPLESLFELVLGRGTGLG